MLSFAAIALLLAIVLAQESGIDIYNGFSGPSRWGDEDVFGENQCDGFHQSPINIEPMDFHFNTTLNGVMDNDGTFPNIDWTSNTEGVLKNIGDALKYEAGIDKTDGIFVRNDGVYDLIQFHFHSPSEHRVNGRAYPVEIHFVHKKRYVQNSVLAVIGVFADFSNATDSFIATMVNASKNLAPNTNVTFSPNYTSIVSGLKASPKIYRYTGSLTIPPCTEGVKWHVASNAFLSISTDDYKVLKQAMPFNSRMTQPLYHVSDEKWQTARKSDYYT